MELGQAYQDVDDIDSWIQGFLSNKDFEEYHMWRYDHTITDFIIDGIEKCYEVEGKLDWLHYSRMELSWDGDWYIEYAIETEQFELIQPIKDLVRKLRGESLKMEMDSESYSL